MARITVVPGLAVRSFVAPAVDRLAAAGHEVDFRPAPAWREVPADLRAYGVDLADRIETAGRVVDLLIGLSVGTQSAAVAAARSSAVRRILLVSPTVDPGQRSAARLVLRWLRGDDHPDAPTFRQQAPDWARAGVLRIGRGMRSAIRVHLEEVLPDVAADLTIVHAGWDNLTTYGFAAQLAAGHGGRLLELPDAPHSWPIGDEERFLAVVEAVLGRSGGVD